MKVVSAVARSSPSSGSSGSSQRVSGAIRVTATSISRSGLAVDTVQSLPNARRAPARSRLPNGYIRAERSGPMKGSVSSST